MARHDVDRDQTLCLPNNRTVSTTCPCRCRSFQCVSHCGGVGVVSSDAVLGTQPRTRRTRRFPCRYTLGYKVLLWIGPGPKICSVAVFVILNIAIPNGDRLGLLEEKGAKGGLKPQVLHRSDHANGSTAY